MPRPSALNPSPGRIRQGLALVDYDNLCRYEKTATKADVELRTLELVDLLASAFRAAFSRLNELDIRFYGGWIDERGLASPDSVRLLEILPGLRGRRCGLIVRPSLATTMVRFPRMILKGTVRLRTPRRGRPWREQKMVDGMLGFDALSAAEGGATRVGIVTDDDDLVPAVLSAHAARAEAIVWMRPRPAGHGLNDRSMTERGVRIHHLPESGHGRHA